MYDTTTIDQTCVSKKRSLAPARDDQPSSSVRFIIILIFFIISYPPAFHHHYWQSLNSLETTMPTILVQQSTITQP